MSIPERKKELRKEKIALRKSIGAEMRSLADHAITKNLESLPELEKFNSLVAYVSDGTEPDLSEIMTRFLENGGTLGLPRLLENHQFDIAKTHSLDNLCVNKWGIPEPGADAEPCSPSELRNSLWLVPGVAFDDHCGRLGRGKGIYDRLLSNGAGLTIGIFYECQNCGGIPADPHDVRLDMIVTDKRIIRKPPNS